MSMAEDEKGNHRSGDDNEEFETSAGLAIAKLLDLRKNEVGRYNTSIGDKTALGLYRTMKRVLTEGLNGDLFSNNK